MLETTLYAGDTLIYTSNVALDNTVTWTANTRLTNLDLQSLIVSNVEIGVLQSNLAPIVTNTPNSINFTLTVTANSNVTSQFMANSVVNLERPLYMFTRFTSNTGIEKHANTVLLRVKAAEI